MNLADLMLYLVIFLSGCAAGSILMFRWFQRQADEYERWISELMRRPES
jgi:hypothetical protein